jgi:hypothetical protein
MRGHCPKGGTPPPSTPKNKDLHDSTPGFPLLYPLCHLGRRALSLILQPLCLYLQPGTPPPPPYVHPIPPKVTQSTQESAEGRRYLTWVWLMAKC